METKSCKICNVELEINKFSFRKDSNNYRDECKLCRTAKQKQYYVTKREYFTADARERRQRNPELTKERNSRNYFNHKEKRVKYYKEYWRKNKEELNKKQKDWREKNPNRSKEYRAKNKDKINAWEREYVKRRMAEDFIYRLRRNIRGRFKRALAGNYKGGSAIEELGCSIEYLKIWLESKYYPNPETGEMMSKENYGTHGWHIDHIIAISKFDLSNPNDVTKACHYTNLQPLWARENIRKSNK